MVEGPAVLKSDDDVGTKRLAQSLENRTRAWDRLVSDFGLHVDTINHHCIGVNMKDNQLEFEVSETIGLRIGG